MKIRIFAFFALAILGICRIAAAQTPVPIHGFLTYNVGSRLVPNDDMSDDVLMNEVTFRMELAKDTDIAAFTFNGDFTYDNYMSDTSFSLREATVDLFAFEACELKAGHQVLTWGTGDMVFVNDLFPKDWKSFFMSRDDEYLKAPSTSLKFSMFSGLGDLNLVLTPTFTPDTYIDGERFSYWGMGGITGENFVAEIPAKTFENAEYHARFAKNIGGLELALYGYKGFFKRPLGFNPEQGTGVFPKLAVYGASLRSQMFGGIVNIESGYYDSLDDRDGTDPMLENAIWKNLVGFEKELIQNLTVSLQYFSEWMQDYDAYTKSIEAIGQEALKEENHDWITLRLTSLQKQQTLILSLFSYYSPAEQDWYLRPLVTYKMSDNLQVSAGANIFGGENAYTFFGQLEDNTNLYARIRYSF
ncbi:hypothetical protein CSB45_13715 [candidate division KSB3 bacterium]|uniref:DUF5723 domain-containing protein n=1 Tax=candidate division KSB3 bacterium TaxID=2044937 RepID=A0A2G6E1C4_9BACT|nr:MAG: hypothetical protein CSB45_13715 [candidate division KSB3 bacterium]PIE28534.1 MAG: hypothetical protein CSA57_13605 [candidate division KSB3 bacterium]